MLYDVIGKQGGKNKKVGYIMPHFLKPPWGSGFSLQDVACAGLVTHNAVGFLLLFPLIFGELYSSSVLSSTK